MSQNNVRPLSFRLGLLLMVSTALAACGHQSETGLKLSASGVVLDNFDNSVRPQDDFYAFVNGRWLAQTEIPADKSSYGSFVVLREEAEEAVHGLIQAAAASDAEPGSAEQLVGSLYNSFMDVKRINGQGLELLEPTLDRIDELSGPEDLLDYFAWSGSVGVKSPLTLDVSEDYMDTTRYRVYLSQSGLGLPNSEYYQDDSAKGQEVITAYRAYTAALFRRLGLDEKEATAASASTYALEKTLAGAHRPPESNREYTRWYNLYGPGHTELPGGLPLGVYLAHYSIAADTVVSLAQPEYFQGLHQIIRDTPLETWKHYLKLRLLSTSASYLDEALQDLSFDFYSRQLFGVPEQRPRWKRGVSAVNGSVGDAVGQMYVEQYFPARAKARMDEMVVNLLEAYRQSIEELDWMGEETRVRALEKLSQFTPNIGFPTHWRRYEGLTFGPDLLDNMWAARRWEKAREVSRLNELVDASEWFMTPQTVNAYYYSLQNSITFPAAILQPPFFDLQADDAVNYGAIGAVIGHEIGHGFDDNGSQFDGRGRLENWWTDTDREAFSALTQVLVEQYDAYEVLPGVNVNGILTQGENIGDLAGVSIAYQAYLRSLHGQSAPVIDGFTGEQRFFIGFAQAFLSKARDERKRQLVKIDTHSPPQFRVNGTLSNLPQFQQAFDVKAGDRMYRPVTQQVKIW